ncbi:alpha/beta fold hydrolase [Stappia sp. ES.058]|uniref:alpha/beta fold hydrolase n=1 Tax=Stappia sp. ES.058 TaxID=1881061 RepID=UPI00087B6133|nr:alpha/beta hydrolase [Stappia sp. ES.058]SDU35984.1 lysophospholipase [Stappia sp. ES.058]
MDLYDHPDNPIPEGGICAEIRTVDGCSLRTARWMPSHRPLKGTVTLLQGRAECIEKYFETISDLRARGFAVVTFDWRGQGGSSRLLRNPKRGHVDDFADFVTDLETVMRDVTLASMPGPHFALAHSTGGLVLLLAAQRLRTQIERAVLSAPLIGLGKVGLSQSVVCPLSSALSVIGLGTSFVPRVGPNASMAFAGNPLTSDPARFQRTEMVLDARGDLEIGMPTIDWLAAACRAMRRVCAPDFGPAMPLPVLIVAAGQDIIVSTRAAEQLALRTRSIRYLEIAGCRHEILMEDDLYRDQFLAAFDAFVADGMPQAVRF